MANDSILDRPAALDEVRRQAKRLCRSARQIQSALVPLVDMAVFPNPKGASTRAAILALVDKEPSLKLIGVLLQLPPRQRLATLTADGGLTLEEAETALRPVELLDASPDLREQLAAVLPSWFPSNNPSTERRHRASGGLVATPRISCLSAHETIEALRTLDARLSSLTRPGLIEKLPNLAFSAPMSAIHGWLEPLDILCVLVSPGLLADDKAMRALSLAMEREPRLRIVPILISPTDLEGSSLAALQPLPMNGLPVLSHERPEEGWLDVMQGLRRIAKQFRLSVQNTEPSEEPLAISSAQGAKVVALYEPRDRVFFEELQRHLAPLERQKKIRLWHPGSLLPGDDVEAVTRQNVDSAAAILLLLSAAFFASDRLAELADRALVRGLEENTVVFRLLLSPFALERGPDWGTLEEKLGRIDYGWMNDAPSRGLLWVDVVRNLSRHLAKLPEGA